MSSSLRRFHAGRVRAEHAALCEVQDALGSTRARRADAQRVLDEVSRETAALEELEQSLAARLAASRYDSLRLCVAALPDDILRCIFEAIPSGGTDPFTIAAVCTQWRKVALALASLWSTIRILAPQTVGLAGMNAYYNSVALRLARSRAALLDISVIWVPDTPFQDDRDETIEVFSDIMDALGSEVSRWRTFRLFLPDLPEMADLCAIQCLKGPTPQLTELVLGTRLSGPQRASSSQGYLPHAPALRRMTLHDGGFALSSRATFSSLTELRIHDGVCTDEEMYEYLARAPALEYLDVNIPVARAPSAKIALPALQSLKVGPNSQPLLLEPLSTLLHVPKLAHLFLRGAPEDGMTPFLNKVSPTVRSLRLSHRLTVPRLTILRHLQTIDELQFGSVSGKSVDRSVLDQLASNDPPIWPRLNSVTELKYLDGMGDHLLGLITARNAASQPEENESHTSERPCRLREITFRFGDEAPRWLAQEMDRLLRL